MAFLCDGDVGITLILESCECHSFDTEAVAVESEEHSALPNYAITIQATVTVPQHWRPLTFSVTYPPFLKPSVPVILKTTIVLLQLQIYPSVSSLLTWKFFFSWRNSPQWAKGSSLSRINDYTQTHHTQHNSSGRVIGPTQKPYLATKYTHMKQTFTRGCW